MIPEITVEEVFELLRSKSKFTIVDVREPWEFKICSIEGSVNIPLRKFEEKFHEIPKNKPIYTLCHHGKRSLRAADALIKAGVNQVFNIMGGIDAWALKVDTSMDRY